MSDDANPATAGGVIVSVIDSSTPSEPTAAGVDVVETALADALRRASEAGAWEAVAQLARELEARRKARSGVVELDLERARRGKAR